MIHVPMGLFGGRADAGSLDVERVSSATWPGVERFVRPGGGAGTRQRFGPPGTRGYRLDAHRGIASIPSRGCEMHGRASGGTFDVGRSNAMRMILTKAPAWRSTGKRWSAWNSNFKRYRSGWSG